MSEFELIRGIHEREDFAFEWIRRNCYNVVRMIVTRNSGQREDAEDVYEEGILSLMQLVDRPNFVLHCKVSTLFITICKNNWLSILEKRKAAYNYQFKHNESCQIDDSSEQMDEDIYQGILKESFNLLKNDCKHILRAYFKELSVKDIAEILGYSPAYLKKKKCYCHKYLVQLVNDHPDYKKLVYSNEILVC